MEEVFKADLCLRKRGFSEISESGGAKAVHQQGAWQWKKEGCPGAEQLVQWLQPSGLRQVGMGGDMHHLLKVPPPPVVSVKGDAHSPYKVHASHG